MKNNKYISSSRKRTPWDNFTNRNELQNFIYVHYKEHYSRAHKPLLLTDGKHLINSKTPLKCPYCSFGSFTRNGYTKNGIQRYKCLACYKTFTVLNGTIFENHKIPISEWIEFCLNLFHYDSISSDSKSNRNSLSTSRYWLYKLFLILENIQDNIVLSDKVYLDETYYSVSISELTLTKDGHKKRGISTNKFCIASAYDRKNVICFVCGKGKPSKSKMLKVFKGHIKEGSTLIHDGENSHEVLVSELNLREEIHPTKETKGLADKDNPLYPINHIHFLLKRFLNAHSGFDREDLQSYLNFFCFKMNPPRNELEKIEILGKVNINISHQPQFLGIRV